MSFMVMRAARRRLLFAGACALLITLSACVGSEASKPAGAATKPAGNPDRANSASAMIQTFQFQPSPLEVRAGAKVTWTNRDDITHTVTSGVPGGKDSRFDGALNGKDMTFSFTFTQPGTYAYFCSRHESMRGEIRVTP